MKKKLLALFLLTGLLASCGITVQDESSVTPTDTSSETTTSDEHEHSHEGESDHDHDHGSSDEEDNTEINLCAAGHNLTHYLAQEPTCTEEGYKEAWFCNVCGELFFTKPAALGDVKEANKPLSSDPRTHIHPEGHDYDGNYVNVKDASCTENGYQLRTCTKCGYEDKKVLPLTGHNYNEPVYLWDFDKMQVTATMHCDNGSGHTKTETVRIVQVSTTPGTCTSTGSIKYKSVAFTTDTAFKSQEYTKTTPRKHKLTYYAAEDSYCVTDSQGHAGHTAYYHCSSCGKYFADAQATIEITYNSTLLAVDPHNHVALENVAAREATCFQVGFNAHQECLACGAKIGYVEVPMTAHTPDTTTWASDGTDHYRLCKKCSAIIESTKEAHIADHDLSDHSVDIHCTVCGHLMQAGDGHVHDKQFVNITPATCTSTGLQPHYECACGKYFSADDPSVEITDISTITIPMAEHTYKDYAAKAGNCTLDSYDAYAQCTVCGKYFNANHTAEITYPDDITHTAPGHDMTGPYQADENYHWHKCANCAHIDEKVLHTPNHDVTLEPDYEGQILCSVCGYEIRPANHHYCRLHLATHAGSDATCESAGAKTYYECGECHKYYSDANAENEVDSGWWVIPATGHAYDTEHWSYDTTHHWYTCANDANHKGDYAAHIPDHTDPGYEGEIHCTVCGYLIEVAGHEHSYVEHVANAATCTEPGNIHYYECSGCHKCFTAQDPDTEITQQETVIPATGHTYGEWNVDPAATCTTAGHRTRECSVCHHIDEEDIPALGHNYVEHEALAPTCTTDGHIHYWECSRCGTLFDETRANIIDDPDDIVVENLGGHNWVVNTAVYNNGFQFFDDGGTMKATVYLICTKTNGETHTDQAVVTAEVETTTSPTCTETGVKTYTATYLGETATMTDSNVTALGHSWHFDKIVIDESGLVATAYYTCTRDENHKTTVQLNGSAITSEVTTPRTCEGWGVTTYTASIAAAESPDHLDHEVSTPFTNLEPLGHVWVYDGLVFDENGRGATASYHCSRCGKESTVRADITSEVTTQPTCSTDGTTTYTATITTAKALDGVERTDTTTRDDIAELKHTYQVTSYKWTSGTTEVKKTEVCQRDTDHVSVTTSSDVATQSTYTHNSRLSPMGKEITTSGKTWTGDLNLEFSNTNSDSSKGRTFETTIKLRFRTESTINTMRVFGVKIDNAHNVNSSTNGNNQLILRSDLTGASSNFSALNGSDSESNAFTTGSSTPVGSTFRTAFYAFIKDCDIVVHVKGDASTGVATIEITYNTNVSGYESYRGYTQTLTAKFNDDFTGWNVANSVRVARLVEGVELEVQSIEYTPNLYKDIFASYCSSSSYSKVGGFMGFNQYYETTDTTLIDVAGV